MPLPFDKQRVRASFDRAAITYDAAAVVQRLVCDRLLEELEELHLEARTSPRILDAGCGTGYGTRMLRARWPSAQITGLDFAPSMLDFARHDTDHCCAADIEKLPFAEARFDLWWSSLTIQWCEAATVFAEAARVLRSGGQVALSTLGPGTFHELRAAFAGVDQHRHTLPFSDADQIASAVTAADFRDVVVHRETHSIYYPDLKTLLRAVKAIGAQNVGDGARSGMLGRNAWQRVEAAYESHRESAGLPATYDVILCYGTR